MKFEMTPELADQIIFGMENQAQELLLDTRETKLVPMKEAEEDPGDPERYIPLPRWRSVDGYNLMERFVAGLRNPVYRETLRGILASGRGVFRQFKDALKERREMERLWFRFKEKEMRKEVVGWYNALREAWGLKEVEIVFEDTGDLILSDFTIEPWQDPDDEFIAAADKAGFDEMFPAERPEKRDGMYHGKRYGVLPSDGRSMVMKAETPAGEPAGFLWAVRNDFRTDLATVHILQVFVFPEYRGLGLAKALFRAFCDMIVKKDIFRITIELMGESLHLNDSFRGEGFSPFSEVLELDLSSRGEREPD